MSYQLLDSGESEKLERFGDKIIIRPSKFSLWKKRSPNLWTQAHARFEPKSGWRTHAKQFDEWEGEFFKVRLRLRLQDNGQIGFFPEHLGYISKIEEAIKHHPQASILNLFAYTGLATVAALKLGATVTHVDISKKCLTWAAENIKLNEIPQERLRLIPEDALKFLDSEIRRGKKYDLVIADPPSFSRISNSKSWQLEEVLEPLIDKMVKVSSDTSAHIFLTSHQYEYGDAVLYNLLLDAIGGRQISLGHEPLYLREANSDRILPSGYLVQAAVNP